MSPTELILLTIFCLLVPINLVGNTLVCLVVFRTKTKRIPVNYFLVNLAIADMIVALFVMLQHILRVFLRHPAPPFGDYFCKVATGGNLVWIGSAASVFTLVSIAFERYYSVMFPHNHKGRLTPRKAKLGILASWLVAVASETPPIAIMRYSVSHNLCIEDWPDIRQARTYTVVTFLIDFVIPFALMTALYGKVLRKLWDSNLCKATHAVLLRRRKKLTLLLFTVTLLHGVFLLPDTVAYFLSYFGFSYSSIAYQIGTVFICLNSTVNPFLYSLHSERFRKSLRKLFGCKGKPARLTFQEKLKDIRELRMRSSLRKPKTSTLLVE